MVLFAMGLAVGTVAVPSHIVAQTGPTPQSTDITAVEPLLPPGISDFNLELYGRLGYTWTMADGTQVVQVLGDFSARLGQYKLTSHDAVVWFHTRQWQDKHYLDAVFFLWQDAQVDEPGGAVETGPVLLITLRTFGKLVLSLDSHAAASAADSDLFREAQKARRLLDVVPTKEAGQAQVPVQVAPSIEQLQLSQPKIRKTVTYTADQTIHEQHGKQSLVVSIGNVFVSQGSPAKSGEYLELRADAAVLYLQADQIGGVLPEMVGRKGEKPATQPIKRRELDRVPANVPPQEEPKLTEGQKRAGRALQKWVSAVYLEGNVILTRGQRMIRASRLYYDFEHDRALILDVVTRAFEPKRGIPIYIRAERVRQLNSTTYDAVRAQITTSEFHTPHVAIGAGKVEFQDLTPRDERGDVIGVQAGSYKARDTTLNIEGTPLAYWPYSAGKFSTDRQALRSAKVGYGNEFGASLETRWYLFNLLGLEQPEGFDATLKLDYFSDRGPAGGVDMDYSGDNYFGLVRSYYVHDDDEDDLGPTRGGKPDHESRGRFLLRHR